MEPSGTGVRYSPASARCLYTLRSAVFQKLPPALFPDSFRICRCCSIPPRLHARVALPSESSIEFFRLWTAKEAIGKYLGTGIRPREIDTTAYLHLNRFTDLITYGGENYRLTMVSEDAGPYVIELDL